MNTIYNMPINELYNDYLSGLGFQCGGVCCVILAILCVVAISLTLTDCDKFSYAMRWTFSATAFVCFVLGFTFLSICKGHTSREDVEAAVIYNIERDNYLSPLKKEQLIKDIKLIWSSKKK